MRIVAANNYYYLRGGSEYVYFLESRLIRGHGHIVMPFSRMHPLNLHSEYCRFFPPHYDPLASGLAGKTSAALKVIYSVDARRRFGQLLDETRPDLVHGHNIYGRLTTSIIDAARGRNLPFLLTLHDYKLVCASYLLLNRGQPCTRCVTGSALNCLLTRCHKGSLAASIVSTAEALFNKATGKYSNVSLFISPSRFLIERHLEAGFPEGRFVHIPNALDMDRYAPDFTPGDYILFAGRLSHEKGILTLLDAVRGMDIRLRVAGDGPMRSECEAFVKEHGMNNVTFEGYHSGEALAGLFRGAMFTVVPSQWYENAPISIMESFAYGKPVIGAAIGGIPEMIDDGSDGLLSKPFDASDLREKIRHLAANPAMIESMGIAARRKALERYSPEPHYNALIAAYSKALG